MASHTENSYVSEESPSKRRRIGDSELIVPPATHIPRLESDSTYAHRQSLQGRAILSNAADSPHFFKNRALVFQFLDVFNVVQDDVGRLK